MSGKTAVLGKVYTLIKILVGQKRGGKRLLCLTVVTLLIVNNKEKPSNNRKTKPMVETMTKTTQYMDDIELQMKKDTNKKIKKISIEIKRM